MSSLLNLATARARITSAPVLNGTATAQSMEQKTPFHLDKTNLQSNRFHLRPGCFFRHHVVLMWARVSGCFPGSTILKLAAQPCVLRPVARNDSPLPAGWLMCSIRTATLICSARCNLPSRDTFSPNRSNSVLHHTNLVTTSLLWLLRDRTAQPSSRLIRLLPCTGDHDLNQTTHVRP